MTTSAATLDWQIEGTTARREGLSGAIVRVFESLSGARSLSVEEASEEVDTVTATQRQDSVSDISVADDVILEMELLRELPEQYTLAHPVRLVVHRSGTCYWVTSDTGFLHGMGETRNDAVEDYAHALVAYFEALQEEEEILAPHLRDQLKELSDIIRRP